MTAGPEACIICLESDPEVGLTTRKCCNTRVCQPCLQKYVSVSIKSAISDIKCPNDTCHVLISQPNVIELLDPEIVELYCQLKVDDEKSNKAKTCPNCKHVTPRPKSATVLRVKKTTAVQCEKCQFKWCFNCHSLLHPGASCRESKKADEAFVVWTSGRQGAQRNAVKCPNCKIYIQRSEGCRHMTCSKCSTHFCYDCGKKRNANNACGCRPNPATTAAAGVRREGDNRRIPTRSAQHDNRGQVWCTRLIPKCCLSGLSALHDSPTTSAGIAVGVFLLVALVVSCVAIVETGLYDDFGYALLIGYITLLCLAPFMWVFCFCWDKYWLFPLVVMFTVMSPLILPVLPIALIIYYT